MEVFQPQIKPLAQRRDRVFILLSALFLGTLVLLNVIGLTHIFSFSISLGSWTIPLILPLGVLPYPITFILCDLLCEFYGRDRANMVVFAGLIVNVWVFVIIWLAGFLPQGIVLDPHTHLPPPDHPDHTFYHIRSLTMGGIAGSMIAYGVSQLLDAYLFQYWKELTKGKHLWLRTNGSTLISQFVDTLIILGFSFFVTLPLSHLPSENKGSLLLTLVLSAYVVKVLLTVVGNIPFYLAVFFIRRYFKETRLFPTFDVALSDSRRNNRG